MAADHDPSSAYGPPSSVRSVMAFGSLTLATTAWNFTLTFEPGIAALALTIGSSTLRKVSPIQRMKPWISPEHCDAYSADSAAHSGCTAFHALGDDNRSSLLKHCPAA